MIDIIFTLVSVAYILVMGLIAKRHLYVHQHESAIKKQLETFEINLEKLKKQDLSDNYQIGSDHIY